MPPKRRRTRGSCHHCMPHARQRALRAIRPMMARIVTLPTMRSVAATPVQTAETCNIFTGRDFMTSAIARVRPGSMLARSTAYQWPQCGQWPLMEYAGRALRQYLQQG